MSNQNWTKEPLTVSREAFCTKLLDSKGGTICHSVTSQDADTEATAQRLADCYNFCAGYSLEGVTLREIVEALESNLTFLNVQGLVCNNFNIARILYNLKELPK